MSDQSPGAVPFCSEPYVKDTGHILSTVRCY